MNEHLVEAGPLPTSEHMRETLVALEAVFERAAVRCGEQDHILRIAGRSVLLRFAGAAMVEQLLPALSHLLDPRARATPPDLTIRIMDTTSTETKLPASPLLPAIDDPPVRPVYRSQSQFFAFHGLESAISILDLDRAAGLYCACSAEGLPRWEWSSPLSALLNWWWQSQGLQLVHSAAVGRRDGGVLATGKGGSGKSTTALACLRAGLEYAGDDYVLLESRPPVAHCQYSSAKLDATHLARHPDLLPHGVQIVPGGTKSVGFLHDVDRHRMAPSLPIAAVVLPAVTDRSRTRISETSLAAGLLSLAPATMLQLPGNGFGAMGFLTALLRQVPCFVLELGRDLHSIPDAISSLLDELGVP